MMPTLEERFPSGEKGKNKGVTFLGEKILEKNLRQTVRPI